MRALLVLGSWLAVSCLIAATPATAAQSDLVIKQSKYSVAETLDRLSAALKTKGINVMARIDHAAGAKAAGMDLKPTQLLIFGNPKMGTPLMQTKRTMALDLPMKVIAWQDDAGATWLAYTKPDILKARHGITGRDKIFSTMAKALNALTDGASK